MKIGLQSVRRVGGMFVATFMSSAGITSPAIWILLAACSIAWVGKVVAAEPSGTGDRWVTEYFEAETTALENQTLEAIESAEDWESRRETYRRQLADMLGLDPMPPRTPLQATIVGTLQHPPAVRAAEPADETRHPAFIVERLHFQPLPGLYVAANFFLPAEIEEPVPAVLYVCGHATGIENGVRMGNKTAYQHHGAWFARHGYACLVIDTIQRGEFEGVHHGTYRYGMWWWNNRGYTPAGVEAWTGIRAVDYLQSRPEVDPQRIGITGRSGGGVYSWWVAALDERIAAAVPVAGITSLRNHVVDGCVEGHCDCMFMVNTYRWDFPLVAALVAPRPLLISNSDKDRIFPLEGVVDVHAKVRKIYRLYNAEDRLGLQITEGPHRDTQELRVHAFRWMNRFLKDDDSLIRLPAEPFFSPSELKVFETLPQDQRVTTIHESFVEAVDPSELPGTREELSRLAAEWRSELLEKTFRGWPSREVLEAPAVSTPPIRGAQPKGSAGRDGLSVQVYELEGQPPYRFPFYVIRRNVTLPDDGQSPLQVMILDQTAWDEAAGALSHYLGDHDSLAGAEPNAEAARSLADKVGESGGTWVLFAPRGVGPTEWSRDERARTHIRRRFMLLGQTDDGMRIWDVRRLLQVLDQTESFSQQPRVLVGSGDAAAWALYASLFEDKISQLSLTDLPLRNRDGISLLNVSRIVEIPQTVLMAADRVGRVELAVAEGDLPAWNEVSGSTLFGDENRIVVKPLP